MHNNKFCVLLGISEGTRDLLPHTSVKKIELNQPLNMVFYEEISQTNFPMSYFETVKKL